MSILEFLQTNQVFSGLVGAGSVAAFTFLTKSLWTNLWAVLVRAATVNIIIRNSNPHYQDVMRWFASQPYAKKCREVAIGMADTDKILTIGYGLHLFWFKRRPILAHRQIDTNTRTTGTEPQEVASFRVLALSRKFADDLVGEMIDCEREELRVFHYDGWWNQVKSKRHRPAQSLILPAGQFERIVSDMEWYLKSEEWYAERSLPYRRGYLFHGIPGTGKTTLAQVLASQFRLPLYVLPVTTLNSDNQLVDAFHNVPKRSLLVIEDIDIVSASRERDSDGEKGVTLNGLLNAIDGVSSSDGRVLVMTTNRRDVLDPALIRPGRVDVDEEIGPLGVSEIRRMVERFYPGLKLRLPVNIAIPGAHAQNILIRCNGNVQAAEHGFADFVANGAEVIPLVRQNGSTK